MSKVICDVCGTAFPETATHCPICGCAKEPTAQVITSDEVQSTAEVSTGNSYARGGRFSKGNMRRQNRSKSSDGSFRSQHSHKDEVQGSNKALVAVVVILLVAIVMVVVYIGVKVFITDNGTNTGNSNQSTVGEPNNGGTTGGKTVACTGIKLNSKLVELKAANQQYLLVAQLEPTNTTDAVIYTSADPAVATVDSTGLIVGVDYGQTTITATCGGVTAECTVICTFGTPPATTVPTVPQATAPVGFVLKLNTYKDSGEITIAAAGGSHMLYTEVNGVKASDIVWTTSDPAVASVVNGKVVGVDRGTAIITATIGNQTATCKVRCPFDAPEPTPYTLKPVDTTIAQGESFHLSLKNAEGANAQNVEWKASKEGIVEIDGNKITGGTVSKLTKVEVYTEYEGHKYTCVVYVKAPDKE